MPTLRTIFISVVLIVATPLLVIWDSPVGWGISFLSLGLWLLVKSIIDKRNRQLYDKSVDDKIITAMKIVTDAMGNLSKNMREVAADVSKQASKIAAHEKRLTHITITEDRIRRSARRDEVLNTQLTNRAARSKRDSDREERKSKE